MQLMHITETNPPGICRWKKTKLPLQLLQHIGQSSFRFNPFIPPMLLRGLY